MIIITMTATKRPEIVRRTLESFKKNLLGDIDQHFLYPCRLIMNIDPIGEDCSPEDVYNVAKSIFPNTIANMPEVANFARAFKWTWLRAARSDLPSQAGSWFLNLEDDWELTHPINLFDMLRIMLANPMLASLRIPFFSAERLRMKNWNLWFPWNGTYFECPEEYTRNAGFCGHPSILRPEFVRYTAPLIRADFNPEKQFHADNPPLVEEVMKWRFGVYGYPNCPKMLSDIGTPWKASHGFQKSGSKAFFTQWKKESNQ